MSDEERKQEQQKVMIEKAREDDVNKDKWKGTIKTISDVFSKKEHVLKNGRKDATTGVRG